MYKHIDIFNFYTIPSFNIVMNVSIKWKRNFVLTINKKDMND